MADVLQYTSFESIEDHVSHVRQIFNTGKPRDLKWRKFQIERLYSLVKENEEKLYDAMYKDMRKPRHEAMSGDIAPVLDECQYFLDNIDKLVKDEVVKARSPINAMDKAVIRKDPLGVILIFGCWNYPVQLSLVPLVGAIAAGNSVILKLSEVSPHTAAVITELFPKYMDTSCYRIVNGAVEETTFLLKQRFDHILYTGNSTVAKIIMEAAAKNLTPTTLELGGKSPAVIAPDADLQVVANRIGWGKFYNSGQICIAVDYVLCPKDRLDEFVQVFRKTIESWYGSNPQTSDSYGRIVAERHVTRVANMLNNRESGEIAFGGVVDVADRYIAPTLVTNVNINDKVLMADEIFGPVLPVVTYNNLDEAIGMINKREPPLVLYVFSNKKTFADKVLKQTQSGGVCINDCLMHQAEYALPFGGVGNSGMGNYHGARSFNTFSHERSVLIKKQKMEFTNSVRYPPYTQKNYNLMRFFMVKHPFLLWLKSYRHPLRIVAILIALIAFYVKRRSN
ncbi:aldehyde dehydrogenase [Backusella circina FSU 941]|nr:aldehyde dehydrogenase [Backusella circina FSU 941]